VNAVRIWDIPPRKLCRNHLLGEHSELHGIWSILTEGKQGYAHHPEVRRWRGKLRALYRKHQEIVTEMLARGYQHNSPLDPALAIGAEQQNTFVDSYEEQVRTLRDKGCDCRI
jgi:hypothetical protein